MEDRITKALWSFSKGKAFLECEKIRKKEVFVTFHIQQLITTQKDKKSQGQVDGHGNN